MINGPDTIVEQALRGLENQRSTLYGAQSVSFETNPRTKLIGEKVRWFVGPWQQLPLDAEAYKATYDSLIPPHLPPSSRALRVGTGWHQVRQPGTQTEVEAFSFGSLSYLEDIPNRYDPTEPLLRRFLAIEGIDPRSTALRMSQEREVIFQVYPDFEYASLMLGYHYALDAGRKPDRALDFLRHDITREQFTKLSKNGMNGWYALRETIMNGGYLTHDGYLTLVAGQYYHDPKNLP